MDGEKSFTLGNIVNRNLFYLQTWVFWVVGEIYFLELFSKSRREVVGSSSVGGILGRTSVGGNLDLFRIYGNSGILYTRIDIFFGTFF